MRVVIVILGLVFLVGCTNADTQYEKEYVLWEKPKESKITISANTYCGEPYITFHSYVWNDRFFEGWDSYLDDNAMEVTFSMKKLSFIFYNIRNLKKLTRFSNSLAECKKCEGVFNKSDCMEEYSNGWFCKGCINSRREVLKKKLESLQCE